MTGMLRAQGALTELRRCVSVTQMKRLGALATYFCSNDKSLKEMYFALQSDPCNHEDYIFSFSGMVFFLLRHGDILVYEFFLGQSFLDFSSSNARTCPVLLALRKASDLWLKTRIWYMNELHINHSLECLLLMMFMVGV